MQWNDFLLSQPSGHLLQSYEWSELQCYLGGQSYRLGALEQGRMIGAMLLSVATVPFSRGRLKWLYCARGPAVEEPGSPALALLIAAAHKLARREKAVVLRIEPNIAEGTPGATSRTEDWVNAYHALGFQTNSTSIHGRRSWVLDLRPDPEDLLANFRKAWRRNIRQAESMGVIVREARNEADFDTYYDLLKLSSKREKFFIHERAYHKEMLNQFRAQGNAVIYLAEHEGEPVASKMLIRFGDWCWDMFAGTSDADHKGHLPKSHILQYHSFLWAKAHDCIYFDFRTIPDVLEPDEEMWRVYHYKKGFGGFSRFHMPTQDYVYRPLIYQAWCTFVELRRARRGADYKKRALRHKQANE
jgi:lipid II:glycine glycyltransferase (peptidoglycan interpeptide bridge formation enzyme)